MKCTVEDILPETRQGDPFVEGSSRGQTNRLETLAPIVGQILIGFEPSPMKVRPADN